MTAVFLLSIATARAQLQLVDVVPSSMNTETGQNSEPNIAVNPANASQVLISAFGTSSSSNPLFLTTNGGTSWSNFQNLATADTSLAWSSSGTAYLSHLSSDGASLLVMKSTNPGGGIPFANTGTAYTPGGGGPDQPWIQANNVGGVDHVYVTFNDLSQSTKTASVRLSTDGGSTFTNKIVEKTIPPFGQDGAAVRLALNGATVYTAFQRWSSQNASGDIIGSIVVEKDTNNGANGFTNLNVTPATNQIFPQGNLGNERLGSDLSLAIDPGNANRLYLAYGAISGSVPVIKVLKSTDAGANWSAAFTTPSNSGLPALAMTTNGTVGLLYTKLLSGNLETHFIETGDDFGTTSELTLSRFKDGTPVSQFDPYIGDYQDLETAGDTFYGTFSASNNTSLFDSQPTFLRDKSLLGNSVAYSIDPYFFSLQAIPEPSSFVLAALGACLLARSSRAKSRDPDGQP